MIPSSQSGEGHRAVDADRLALGPVHGHGVAVRIELCPCGNRDHLEVSLTAGRGLHGGGLQQHHIHALGSYSPAGQVAAQGHRPRAPGLVEHPQRGGLRVTHPDPVRCLRPAL